MPIEPVHAYWSLVHGWRSALRLAQAPRPGPALDSLLYMSARHAARWPRPQALNHLRAGRPRGGRPEHLGGDICSQATRTRPLLSCRPVGRRAARCSAKGSSSKSSFFAGFRTVGSPAIAEAGSPVARSIRSDSPSMPRSSQAVVSVRTHSRAHQMRGAGVLGSHRCMMPPLASARTSYVAALTSRVAARSDHRPGQSAAVKSSMCRRQIMQAISEALTSRLRTILFHRARRAPEPPFRIIFFRGRWVD